MTFGNKKLLQVFIYLFTQGLNAIDAAVHKGLTHVVYNGSENIKKAIGKECGHLDSKAAIEEYLREVGKLKSYKKSVYFAVGK